MAAWIKGHKKLLVTTLLLMAPVVYGGVIWHLKVNVAITETLPDAVEVLNDDSRAIIRMETEIDFLQDDVDELKDIKDDVDDLGVMVRAMYLIITGDEPLMREQ